MSSGEGLKFFCLGKSLQKHCKLVLCSNVNKFYLRSAYDKKICNGNPSHPPPPPPKKKKKNKKKKPCVFMYLQYRSYKNSVGKGEIAIFPFPPEFSTFLANFPPFSSIQNCFLRQSLSVSRSLKFVVKEMAITH